MKLAILGDPAVGKTSLRRRYLGKGFKKNYIATIGADFSVKKYKLEGEIPTMVQAAIWDIAGQTRYNELASNFYKGAQGAFVVYDVTSAESLKHVPEWVDRFKIHSGHEHTPIVLIGNKVDLIPELTEMDQLRMVQKLGATYPNTPIYSYRTSAKTGEMVDQAFSDLITRILDQIREDEDSDEEDQDIKLWEFSERYRQIEFVKCRNCDLYIEDDPHQIQCPHCNKVMVVADRISGYVEK